MLAVLVVRGCARNKKWWPLPVTLLLMGLNALFQFYRDNKLTFLWQEGLQWFAENAVVVSRYAFVLLSAALILVSLQALAPKKR